MTSRNRSMGEVMEAAFGDRLGQLSAVVPAEVVTWDKITETVEAKPLITGQGGEARPNVHQCPVVFPAAYWDIQVGETGMLLVCDQDFRDWWRTGQQSEPATRQSHQIGNSLFVPGLRSQTTLESTRRMQPCLTSQPLSDLCYSAARQRTRPQCMSFF